MQLRQWRALGLFAALGIILITLVETRVTAEEANAAKSMASEARMKKDITFLASDECEGRGPTTKGLVMAGDYIAEEFKKAGLKPGGKDGTYFQPFGVPGAKLDSPATFALLGPNGVRIDLKSGSQFHPLAPSQSGKLTAPLVFVGYGITSEKKDEKDKTPAYDDYQGLDVEGKIVVILRDSPRAGNNFTLERPWKQRHGSLQQKIQNAEKHKAAGIVFINDYEMAKEGDDLMDFNFLAMVSMTSKLPVFTVRRSLVNDLLLANGSDSLDRIEQDIDRELKPHSVTIKDWNADVQVSTSRSKEMLPLRNVIGYLDGNGPQANEIVVVGAHYDHVGYGGFGSIAQVKKPTIHHGADDNASGSTAILELARRFAEMPNRQGRKLVFMTFSGEELGLLGSRYFCNNPLIPLKDVAAMINLDMVGRMSPDKDAKKDKLLVEGTGSAKMWDPLIDSLNTKYDFKLAKTPGVIPYSDHHSFYAKKVPVCFFWSGYHPDYHRPSDTSDRINVNGMRRIVDLTEEVLASIATTTDRPQYQEVKSGGGGSPGRTSGPRLGIAPAYGEEGEGVLVESVSEGGPAEKGGVKKGDRIIEIAGKPVKNLEAYMSAMAGQKRGEELELSVLRDKKKVTLKVKPE